MAVGEGELHRVAPDELHVRDADVVRYRLDVEGANSCPLIDAAGAGAFTTKLSYGMTQAVKLLVKIKEGKKMNSSDILIHCKKNLERFKVPVEIEFVPDFPRNEYGKIIRFRIKENNNGNS